MAGLQPPETRSKLPAASFVAVQLSDFAEDMTASPVKLRQQLLERRAQLREHMLDEAPDDCRIDLRVLMAEDVISRPHIRSGDVKAAGEHVVLTKGQKPLDMILGGSLASAPARAILKKCSRFHASDSPLGKVARLRDSFRH